MITILSVFFTAEDPLLEEKGFPQPPLLTPPL